MPEVKFTKKAIVDLTNIWYFTLNNWSEKQADIYYHELKNQCLNLIHNPKKGKSYFDLADELRGIKIKKHIIFYQITYNNNIEITRILHIRMDLKNYLKK